METAWSTETCVVCDAPLRAGELSKHLVGCITLTMSSMRNLVQTVEVPEDLAAYCRYIHRKDQDEAARDLRHPDTHLPLQERDTPALERYRNWLREQREGYHPGHTPHTPDGKVVCLVCNGLTHMYPSCVGCDGKGYID